MRQQPRAECVDNGMWGVGGADSGVIYYSFSIKHLETKENLYPIFFVEPALTCCLHAVQVRLALVLCSR